MGTRGWETGHWEHRSDNQRMQGSTYKFFSMQLFYCNIKQFLENKDYKRLPKF